MRDLAPRFEHKLFLSATPHNGHSNSFAALLEMLDPQRFCRGVPIQGAAGRKLLDSVMVRRLKRDLREIDNSAFPDRQIVPIRVSHLPEDAPELELAKLLQQYRRCRNERLKMATESSRRTAMLVVVSRQKRLLSSIEAFARTLAVHRRAVERQSEQAQSELRDGQLTMRPQVAHPCPQENFDLLAEAPDSDDDRAELSEDEVEAEADLQMTRASMHDRPSLTELELLERMGAIAERARYEVDGKLQALIDWIRENLCPDLGKPNAQWNERRVLIFTEYTDTKRYLQHRLSEAITNSNRAEDRIEIFQGGMNNERQEAIKLAFNRHPQVHPLRILIATDAAREGVNLQNHCADLFHFDVPWNPSRMEQRNGRIDRKLQRAKVVRCHYFVLTQRQEDKVLETLVRKTETIQQELGNLSPVVVRNLSTRLEAGIEGEQVEQLSLEIEQVQAPETVREELETIRPEVQKLCQQEEELQAMLQKSQQWLSLDDRALREALSAALEVLGPPKLSAVDPEAAINNIEQAQWQFPALDRLPGADPSWAATLDSLRSPRQPDQKIYQWRRESPIRPVVFADPGTLDGNVVHLHLEHRLVQRLLGRFRTQGFIHDELSRACVCGTTDAVPKVLVFGRLSLYGEGASRLHDEVLCVAAEWREPELRAGGTLRPLDAAAESKAIAELNTALVTPRLQVSDDDPLQAKLKAGVTKDITDLLRPLEAKSQQCQEAAEQALKKRGQREANSMRELLKRQRDRIAEQYHEQDLEVVQLELNLKEFRQMETDRRYWERRLDQLETEIETEPKRIRQMYAVKASRVEPIGVAYLWPVSS